MPVSKLLWLAPISSVLALGFAYDLARGILKSDEGSERMKEIAGAVRLGAMAYLKRQYLTVSIFFAGMFCVLLGMAFYGYFDIFVPVAFLTGGFFSALSGFIGMTVATQASHRPAQAVTRSLNAGLRIAFSSAVMGLTVVGGTAYLSAGYYVLDWYYSGHPLPAGTDKITAIKSTLLCSGMGASCQAHYARVGGGIFTKAADVGADLVGKIEAGITEDDPRSQTVIADNVGDNVGDVAGMGADLYESYVGSIVAAASLGVAAGLGGAGVTIPMALASAGILASVIGTFFVKTGEEASQKVLLAAVRKGVFVSSLVVAVLSYFLITEILGLSTSVFIGQPWLVWRRITHRSLHGIFHLEQVFPGPFYR